MKPVFLLSLILSLVFLPSCEEIKEDEVQSSKEDKAQVILVSPKLPSPPPLFPWEQENAVQAEYRLSLYEQIQNAETGTQLLETIEEWLLIACKAKARGELNVDLIQDEIEYVEDLALVARADGVAPRILFLGKELNFLKAHILVDGSPPEWLQQRNGWMDTFSGKNRTQLEGRLAKETPEEVRQYFAPGIDPYTIYKEGLLSFLNNPYDPPDKACAFIEWASPELALDVYLNAYSHHGDTLPGLKVRYRTGRLLRKLGQPGVLQHIEFAAGKGLQLAILEAARMRKGMQGEDNAKTALYWYRQLELNHLEFYKSVAPEADGYIAELEAQSPGILYEWWEQLAVSDPKYMKKLGDYWMAAGEEGTLKALELYVQAASADYPGAALALANHYFKECERLFTKAEEEDAFFHWSAKASKTDPREGHYLLSKAFEQGWGISKDKEQERMALMKSARHGGAEAGLQLARGFEKGRWGDRNLVESLAWYEWSGLDPEKVSSLRKRLGRDNLVPQANARLAQLKSLCLEPVERKPI